MLRTRVGPGVVVAVALLAGGCGGATDAVTGCEPADGLTPVCGFRNPEDLAALPGGTWMVVSQFPGTQGGGGGSLVAFRPVDGRKLALFPDPSGKPAVPRPRDADDAWGAADCPGPPDSERFSPHGIDVDRRAHRLAVVNHGEREAVELFELGHSRRGPAAVWRGCVPLPDDAWANDVALLGGGGFVVTRMFGRGRVARVVGLGRMLVGASSGYVLEWHPGRGFQQLPNSEGSGPNGIAVSADGRDVYFAEWAGSRLVRVRRDASGSFVRRDVVDLPHLPDNITRARNGELLVTGQQGPIGEVLGCGRTETGACALPFSVVRVAPGTLDVRLLVDHPATAQGAGTVALEFGDEIFIGSFDGDRLARMPRAR